MKNSIFHPLTVLLIGAFRAAAIEGEYRDEVLTDNPIAYWEFEEEAGPTAAESSGNANDGSYVGGVTFAQAGAHPNLGSAISLDGSSGRVDVPNLGSFTRSSIEF